ncbi:MAG: hypothetical protein ATN34_00280 [Epulopiscium sp. Nele67-Bin002]|nr:MAG: hypothetical protein BEN18_11050 [Epulopiscium sp. Nuni2H_MBin001]OON92377.1 MAG: hypothetical protein ATN34_00280 [Epulopiscium sp. Nele67-Bin002]OON93200.1 MAG: hypothetical protein ATN33_00530 [Epulopiscium sp. Nele67-Bin001]
MIKSIKSFSIGVLIGVIVVIFCTIFGSNAVQVFNLIRAVLFIPASLLMLICAFSLLTKNQVPITILLSVSIGILVVGITCDYIQFYSQ